MMSEQKQKTAVIIFSVASNSILVILKLLIGWLTGSISILSEAVHSGIDLLAALIAFFAVRNSGKPADEKHPFGHDKIENISGLVEAMLIFMAAGWIIYEAVKKLIKPEPLEALGWGMAVMLFSSVINIIVSKRLFKIGRKTESMAIQADACHLQMDVWTSAGVMTGLGLIWLSEILWKGMHFHWIDPIAAIIVAVLIIKAAYDLTHQSIHDLLDSSLTADEIEHICTNIMAYCPQIHGFHRLRTRKAGKNRFIEFHLKVKRDMTVEESHHLTTIITEKIQEQIPIANVNIHIEPCRHEYCSDICIKGCLLTPEKRDKKHL
ncbi:cation transporter [Candidatus Desantisbacteria bacterium CG_4_9_14_3_um_filter_40_11]|uniref:Cation transporter n=5 Tax=unclassified Candidatus Desantisiibacteriota TaxID=3106372 RepID=A0A2M7JDV4_9BACT|nr:MAG: cation-efflux pump [Candidatus Desantisbacteria bacterium CG23_combo_of_CG06-09_8_20_14_all_40_23]PIX17581.1 MAG: cation transporter [Candidatus Desantisbacteria bacterium CG_4_8_14_3_um_filter_40_12]PIY19008.1 MAG: cation transporter [Candidatus Desantisbacteria bacterium CG_4_10_14_3_um_filter_40_18]PJB27902.1 MAG: cation transporter [Candidatus Desantisbacteria bacterium CG_4_9_14_3_um_filter_40_11]